MVPFEAFSTEAPHSSSAFCSGCAGGTQCDSFKSNVLSCAPAGGAAGAGPGGGGGEGGGRDGVWIESSPGGVGEPIDYGPLAEWVGFNLRMAQAAAFQAFSRLAQEIGTRPGRFATLMLIGRNPGISQTALSRANGRDKSSLTPGLNDLPRRGFVI